MYHRIVPDYKNYNNRQRESKSGYTPTPEEPRATGVSPFGNLNPLSGLHHLYQHAEGKRTLGLRPKEPQTS